MTVLRLGTRASVLALVQANLVRDSLLASSPGVAVELVEITSSPGDIDKTSALTEGRGWFTSTIQEALLAGEIDIAVHSYKDLPTAEVPGLTVAAVPMRADPRDVIITRGATLAELSPQATVGTSSPRREAQIRHLRPDLEIKPIRGNVETRISKVDKGEYDATVLALAGLVRLGISQRANQVLTVDEMLPAPAQGALAVECRADDATAIGTLGPLNHIPTRNAVDVERAFLAKLEAGCSFPAAALATEDGQGITLEALVADTSGIKRESVQGDAGDGVLLGTRVAESLLGWLNR